MGPIAGQKVEWSQKPKKYAVTCFSRASDPVAAGLGASIGWYQAPTNAKIRNRCFPGHPRPISPRVSPWRYEANARHVDPPLLAKLRPKTVRPCTQMIIAASNMTPNPGYPGWSPRFTQKFSV